MTLIDWRKILSENKMFAKQETDVHHRKARNKNTMLLEHFVFFCFW